jgi:hypothetical protein
VAALRSIKLPSAQIEDAPASLPSSGFGVEVWVMRDGKIAVWDAAFNTGRADQTNSVVDLLR